MDHDHGNNLKLSEMSCCKWTTEDQPGQNGSREANLKFEFLLNSCAIDVVLASIRVSCLLRASRVGCEERPPERLTNPATRRVLEVNLLNPCPQVVRESMFTNMCHGGIALVLAASAACVSADDNVLFNGKNIEGWTFTASDREDQAISVDEAWIVQDGLLVSTGACTGFLTHESEFENYVLTLQWRSARHKGNGLVVGGSGSVFVHVSDEKGAFQSPKSIEIAVFNDTGSIYMRDVEPFGEKEWAFRAPDFVDDLEHEWGEWNELRLICHGNRITAIVNGTPVNQVDDLLRTKGAIALNSHRGLLPALSFYRNIRVQPLSRETELEEENATSRLAELKAASAREEAAAQASRLEEERQEKMRADEFSRQWATIQVSPDIDFVADALGLPFPTDAREIEFDATFGDIELVSDTSMAKLSTFYRTEMARRGWDEVEKERDEESVEVTFKHGRAQVELSLDQESDGVEISLDCRGLSFESTNDPAKLVAIGLPQPQSYLFLQQTFKFPANIRDLTFDGGDRCLFKSDLGLQEAFDQLGQQLRAQGYRETRRPIVSDNRRYTEFAKGRDEVSINVFSHEGGSRAILTHEQN